MTTTEATDIDSNPEPKALTLYGKMLTFSHLRLETDDLAEIEATLKRLLTNKSSQIPVVINSDIAQDLSAVVELLWSWGLQPIGVIDGILKPQAIKMHLAVFPSDGKRIESLPIPPNNTIAQAVVAPSTAATAKASTPIVDDSSYNKEKAQGRAVTTQQTKDNEADHDVEFLPTGQTTHMVYDQMLRSGQSINHVGGDLILTNSINNGAEVITDNSLHIYGRASGRLVAGATGDKNARIFCQNFNPSLVSVAGTYCLRDSIPEEMMDKPVQVSYVEGEGLKFEIMNNT